MPILVPICQQLGIDLVHFGLVMVLNLMIGLVVLHAALVPATSPGVTVTVGPERTVLEAVAAGAAAVLASGVAINALLAVALGLVLGLLAGFDRPDAVAPAERPRRAHRW